MAKEKPMVSNALYLIELNMSDQPDYNEQKLLDLPDDFYKEHKVLKVPILHRAEGAYWSELIGFRKGYINRFRFKIASISLSYIDEIARYFGTHRYIAILPTDLGLQVFYAPFRKCLIALHGQDPLRHTCSLNVGPNYHPFYYLANMEKDDLDCVATWIMDEVKE